MVQGGRDVVGSAARAPERVARQFDRSAVSDKAAIDSNSSVSVAEPTMPEAAKSLAPRPAVSGTYSPWNVAKPQLEPVVVERSLEERLDRAERELVCARMIDNWSRCQQETARWSRIVTDIKRQIAERDAQVSHA